VQWARDLAQQLLAEPLPRRWAHVQGVGRRAESIARIVGDDGELLICAAWLHDIGYSPELVGSGLHALDGARYLRDVAHAEDRLCRLVAYHSCAYIEAMNRGQTEQLAEFLPVGGLTADALTYCDMTTTPDGELTDVDSRLAEIADRYEDGDVVAESIKMAGPEIKVSAKKVTAALSS
jgi:predicted hydrolase (HD superfamily)